MEQYGPFAGRSGTAHLSAPAFCAVPAGSRHRAGDLCFTAWGTARNVTGRRRSMERLRKLCGALGEEISASRTLRNRKTDRQTK